MKKTKIEQRVENAFNAFFDNENLDDILLTHTEDENLLRGNALQVFTDKMDTFIKFLKQAFLFFPGTFVLFYISLGTILFFNQTRFHAGDSMRMFWCYLTGFAAIFMTWFGLGNIKNIRHGIVPLSIISTAVIIGFISVLTAGIFSLHEKLTKDFNFAVMLFPLALVIPILAKNWIDKIDKNSDGV